MRVLLTSSLTCALVVVCLMLAVSRQSVYTPLNTSRPRLQYSHTSMIPAVTWPGSADRYDCYCGSGLSTTAAAGVVGEMSFQRRRQSDIVDGVSLATAGDVNSGPPPSTHDHTGDNPPLVAAAAVDAADALRLEVDNVSADACCHSISRVLHQTSDDLTVPSQVRCHSIYSQGSNCRGCGLNPPVHVYRRSFLSENRFKISILCKISNISTYDPQFF